MKKILIGYKGIFLLPRLLSEGITESFLNDVKSIIDNHKEMIYNHFSDCHVDFIFSSYENEELEKFYTNHLKPISYSNIPSSNCTTSATWNPQLLHHKNLISKIKEHGDSDLFIITRPDIKFLRNFDTFNIDESKFNIVVEHNGHTKNCDDNFWVFPREHLQSYESCIDIMIGQGKTTHEINHELNRLNVPINYLTEYLCTMEIGQDIFSTYKYGWEKFVWTKENPPTAPWGMISDE